LDTAAHLESLAQTLQSLAPGLVYWSGVGFLDAVPEPLRQAVGEEWSLESVEGYSSYLAFSKSAEDKRLTVVLAAPCPPDQLAAVRLLQAAGHLGCVVVLERRRPTSWGGWTLPAPLSPLWKRHSATGAYLDELGFHEGGWVEWESTQRCQSRLASALELALQQSPGYLVVTCHEGQPEFELEAAVAPRAGVPHQLASATPNRLAAVKVGPPDTVYGRFSRELASLVPAGKLLWLDPSAADAPKTMEQHLKMFGQLEKGRPGRPVLVVPSCLLPSMYAELRAWCCDTSRTPPLLVVFGSGIPGATRSCGSAPGGGLTDGHLLLSIPELMLARPADETEARVLFQEAMNSSGAAALVFSQAPAVGLPGPAAAAPGRGRRLREGNDLAILALGSTVFPALLAAESLQAVGLQVAVYDLRYRRPMDREMLAEAATFPLLVTVEEGPESSSFGSHLLFSGTSSRVLRLSVEVAELKQRLAEEPHPLSLESFGLHAEGIARAVKSALQLGPVGGF
jgi:hypothetical protein